MCDGNQQPVSCRISAGRLLHVEVENEVQEIYLPSGCENCAIFNFVKERFHLRQRSQLLLPGVPVGLARLRLTSQALQRQRHIPNGML